MTTAQPAGVIVVINPDQDPVTIAWSKVDVYAEIASRSDDEIARMKGKVERAKADVVSAQQSLDDAKANKVTRGEALDAAKAELAAVEAEHPEDAEAARERRTLARAQRRKELKDAMVLLEREN